MVVRADAAADVEAEGTHRNPRGGDVVGAEAPGEENGFAGGFHDATRERPVVRAAGAAEFFHREVRVAGVEEERVDVRRNGERLGDGDVVEDVDDLDEANAGERAAEIGVRAAREGVDELQGARAAAVVLRDDRVGIGERGEQKRGDGRRDGGGDFGDKALVGNDAGAAGHRGDEPDGVGAMRDGGAGLGDGFDAADFDARARRHGTSVANAGALGNMNCAAGAGRHNGGMSDGEEQAGAPWRQWGTDIDAQSVAQMREACELPVAVRGALMPDAHVGYGLPIGGVLATDGAVIPYAVGVDIACRVMLSVLDLPVTWLREQPERLAQAIERETRFGVGVEFKHPRDHEVMDENWDVSPVTRANRDRAWRQLGTSGSGNHFVEFGVLTVDGDALGLEPGEHLALLSHSGSRGTGAAVCDYYSKAAQKKRPGFGRLAWLKLKEPEGHEYWEAMELMGRYASANHACIHEHVVAHLGAAVCWQLENHHNFAWRETHDGREVIVHRKGATPAGAGVLGFIPGSMATPGFVVRGRGNAAALNSAAHGAGRVMSRTQAKKTLDWKAAQRVLDERGVHLLSAGLDEVPMVYKDINAVMAAQADLVEPLARFDPKLVKMAPPGERPED